MSLNVHHLELFYFVAKHEGITEAVRKMPYGIQQPAVSGQILQLERSLGVKLFHRRPFALTPAGEELYDFVYPFFSRLDHIAGRLRGEESQHLRLAASAAVLTHHLPNVLRRMRAEFPDLRLTLREVRSSEIEAALQKQEADVAVTVLHRRTAPGVKSLKLVDLPLLLLAPPGADVARFAALAKAAAVSGGHLSEPLVSLPPNETISRLFQEGLTRRGLTWEPSMEVSEFGLIPQYVGDGFGWGVTVEIPGVALPETVRRVALPAEFEALAVGILHTGDLKPVAARFVEVAKQYAAQLTEGGGASKKRAAKR